MSAGENGISSRGWGTDGSGRDSGVAYLLLLEYGELIEFKTLVSGMEKKTGSGLEMKRS